MAVVEGLQTFLVRDLRDTLKAGFRRTPAVSVDGGRWLARWALLSAMVGLTLFVFCGYHAGFERLNTLAGVLPDWLWQCLTMLGDERVAFALALVFTRRYPRVFWSLIVAALLGAAFVHSLKPLVSAMRPPAVLEMGSFGLIGPGHRTESFPSGHTVTGAIFFGVWVYHIRARWLRMLLVLLAVGVGLSRVAVGVHWPVDVAAGLAGGVTAAWLGACLARWGEALGMEPALHLAFVTLAAAMAASLFFWDGGYWATAGLQRLLALVALGSTVLGYLIGPLMRWRASRVPAG